GSNTLFEMNYLGDFSRAELFAAHDAWARRYTPPLAQMPEYPDWNRDPERKLRIGYVSGDFARHPVGFLFQDVVANHDRSQVEIHCFSMVFQPDEATEQIRSSVDHWEDIFLLNDEEATAALRAAQLDILVDLSGHTAFHRLPSFAQRPAPVQVSWIGYFHSTGLSAMDYFLTDPYTSPADNGQLFSEIPLCLPATRFCFRPLSYSAEVGPLPAAANGYITFGSFNRLPKLTKQVIAAWSKIVLAVPDSRLVLKARALKDPVVRERLLARFAEQGLAAERIELREVSSHAQMFSEYNDLDLALDPFPFNGGMTTLEALWMGVPVLTLEGDTVVSRQSHAALANVGLTEELSCPDVESYVARAITLAQQPAELARLRAALRPRMAESPLCRPEQFSRDLEALYRDMWRAWCAGERLPAYYMAHDQPAQPAEAGV
ncbi:MAG TPA: glycosyltransferase, partial [Rhodocyclaceae bacterium]|nr:glycosyltransferase [Rhodocyclaceae bacterium]